MASHDIAWVPRVIIHLGTLDFVVTVDGGLARVPPQQQPRTDDVDAVIESLGELRLDALENRTPEQPQSTETDAEQLVSSSFAYAGPNPSWQDLQTFTLCFANVALQLFGGEPLSPERHDEGSTSRLRPLSLHNALQTLDSLAVGVRMPTLDDIEFVGMADHVENSINNIFSDSEIYSESGSSEGSHHPSRECFMAGTPDGNITDTEDSAPQAAAAHNTVHGGRSGLWLLLKHLHRPYLCRQHRRRPVRITSGLSSCRPDSRSSMKNGGGWSKTKPSSSKKSRSATPTKGAHVPEHAT